MEIRRRVGLPRMFLHVMNRGARKVSIFASEADRQIFVGLLGRFANKYEVRIVSWCLMPNHFHLESDAEGTPLYQMMRDLDGNHARAFNERHETTGCLFQGPFKSMAIDDPRGLAYVSRYIHRNPIDLGIAPEMYRWSSCRSYLGLEPTPDWLNPSPVMAWVRQEGMSDGEAYLRYLQSAPPMRKKRAGVQDEAQNFYEEWIRYLEEKCSEKLLGYEAVLQGMAFSTIVTWVASRIYGVPGAAIAAYFGYANAKSVHSITWRLEKRMTENPELADALEVLRFLRRRKLN